MPRPRRSPQEVSEEKEAKQKAVEDAQAKKATAIARIAVIEQASGEQDFGRDTSEHLRDARGSPPLINDTDSVSRKPPRLTLKLRKPAAVQKADGELHTHMVLSHRTYHYLASVDPEQDHLLVESTAVSLVSIMEEAVGVEVDHTGGSAAESGESEDEYQPNSAEDYSGESEVDVPASQIEVLESTATVSVLPVPSPALKLAQASRKRVGREAVEAVKSGMPAMPTLSVGKRKHPEEAESAHR